MAALAKVNLTRSRQWRLGNFPICANGLLSHLLAVALLLREDTDFACLDMYWSFCKRCLWPLTYTKLGRRRVQACHIDSKDISIDFAPGVFSGVRPEVGEHCELTLPPATAGLIWEFVRWVYKVLLTARLRTLEIVPDSISI